MQTMIFVSLLFNALIYVYFDYICLIVLLQLQITFFPDFFVNTIAAKISWKEVNMVDWEQYMSDV